MDVEILLSVCISFLLFIVIIAVLFRITKKEEAIPSMIRAFVIVGLIVGISRLSFWTTSDYVWWGTLYGLLTALFVFGIFSILEASLTIRILNEIGCAKQGISTKEIMKTYNKKLIVKRRIERLVYSGELVHVGGIYILGKTSYFMWRERFLQIFRLAFDIS